MTEIVTRQQAKQAGLKYYFTGKPCPKGHVHRRSVSAGACQRCRDEAQKIYQAKYPEKGRASSYRWTKKYPDRVRARNFRVWRQIERPKRERELAERAGRPRASACEICGTLRGCRFGLTHFDHDHKTGRFRGWLCYRCNATIGRCEDDPELLRKLADYLERQK